MFCSLNQSRRPALWNSLPDQVREPLFDQQDEEVTPEILPEMSQFSQVIADYAATGLSLKGHPLQIFRPRFTELNIVTADSLRNQEPDRRVRVAGIVLNRQHPGTARGITFITLEDETGTANMIVHPDVWNRFRTVARTATALVVRGLLQSESGVMHIIADQLQDLSSTVAGGRYQSRDFQ